MVSPLEKAVDFFREFGLFDVVLPFLLVFSITFAILEKTMILGVEKIKDKPDMPKRALNTTVAFVVAMFVVATNKIVMALNKALPNIVLLVVIVVSFLMLIGSFYKTGEFDFFNQETGFKGAKIGIFIAMLFAVILIFANSIMRTDDESWLEYLWNYVVNNISGPVVTSFVFLIVAVAAIFYVTKGTGSPESDK